MADEHVILNRNILVALLEQRLVQTRKGISPE